MKREILIITVLSTVSVLAGIMLYRLLIFQPEIVSAPRTQDQPPLSLTFDKIILPDTNRQPQALTQWNEKPLLIINFWAPWCAPCRREIPALIEIQQEYNQQLQLVGLSFDSHENVREFYKQYDFNYPLLLVEQQAQQLNRYFGNHSSGLPYTVILNARREIIYQHSGEVDKSQLVSIIKPELEN